MPPQGPKMCQVFCYQNKRQLMLSLAVIITKKNSLGFQWLQGTVLYVKITNITVRKKKNVACVEVILR